MENQLITLRKSQGGKDIVSARELHQFLEVGTRFDIWFGRRIEEFNFAQRVDYQGPILDKVTGAGDYAITLDMAKELSMLERNEKGQQARRYFIECEKTLRQQLVTTPALPDFSNPVIAARAWADAVEQKLQVQEQLKLEVGKKEEARQETQRLLVIAQQAEEQLHIAEQLIEQQAPSVEIVNFLTTAEDTLTIAEAAKILDVPGLGPQKLRTFLKDRGVLMKSDGLPFQRYSNYFTVKVTVYEPANEKPRSNKQVLVRTIDGLKFLRKILIREGMIPAPARK